MYGEGSRVCGIVLRSFQNYSGICLKSQDSFLLLFFSPFLTHDIKQSQDCSNFYLLIQFHEVLLCEKYHNKEYSKYFTLHQGHTQAFGNIAELIIM